MKKWELEGIIIGFPNEKLALPTGEHPRILEEGDTPHTLIEKTSELCRIILQKCVAWFIRVF
ncbi:MAG: hypothetical protein KAJ45_01930 [Desulfobulbaceae bacterium]|nr:hypothetical protein [Desulfobulbaceae bacterium]MCK5544022.1 hypothetical protein [Desulfobulbaceae bacterium]